MIRYKRIKLPLILTFFACFLLVFFASVRNSDDIPVNANENKLKTIVLDAGHGGEDPGCVGLNGELEKEINLKIVKNLEEILLFSGFNVVLTRNEDISIHDNGITGLRNQKVSDMQNRKKIVDSYPDSIFLSIHQNQFTSPQIFGAQMFYSENSEDNLKLAQTLQKNFRDLDQDNNREVKIIDNGLYLFKNSVQPSVLIECGFLSNPKDVANLGNNEYQKMVSFTIYKSLLEYIEEVSDRTVSSEESQRKEVNEIKDVLYMQSDHLTVGG
ncbi:MAG: N-acetylmuramoyl-L-alanine amidase [Eubacterium sp.]|jgi:N-acetylmuramoyl-L-alanine amidase|nr:N-acetylmuramoyl-L-alanine amidase [Eubacterium sp.]